MPELRKDPTVGRWVIIATERVRRSTELAAPAPGWRVRVVPNKFPALRVEGELARRGEGIYDVMSGIGAHEVVIESPDHDTPLAALPQPAVEDVVRAYRDRIVDLRQIGRASCRERV